LSSDSMWAMVSAVEEVLMGVGQNAWQVKGRCSPG